LNVQYNCTQFIDWVKGKIVVGNACCFWQVNGGKFFGTGPVAGHTDGHYKAEKLFNRPLPSVVRETEGTEEGMIFEMKIFSVASASLW
jgi:hypothetical protein